MPTSAPTDPLRIALLTVSADAVGPMRTLLLLAGGLDRKHFAPHIITAVRPGPVGAAMLEGLDVPIASLDVQGPTDPRGIWRLARFLRRWRIDIVHARLQRAAFYARMAAPLSGWPVVLANVSNMYGHHFAAQHGPGLGTALFAIDRVTRRLVDVWVANSSGVARDLARTMGIPLEHVHVVPNAIDADRFITSPHRRIQVRSALGIAHEAWVVGCVSRLVPLKQIEHLIAAVARMPESPRPVLLIVGDGVAREALKAQARAEHVEAVFTGERQDIPELLSAMDVFALPSASEGQPNVVLEAMAAGLPVVVPNIDGMSDLVEHNISGLVIEPGIPPLLAALSNVRSNPSAAHKLGEAARARVVMDFSPTGMVSRFESLYLQVVQQRI